MEITGNSEKLNIEMTYDELLSMVVLFKAFEASMDMTQENNNAKKALQDQYNLVKEFKKKIPSFVKSTFNRGK